MLRFAAVGHSSCPVDKDADKSNLQGKRGQDMSQRESETGVVLSIQFYFISEVQLFSCP